MDVRDCRAVAAAPVASAEALPAFAATGIELEYMIVDATTLAVRPLAPALLAALGARREGVEWSNEIVKHVVELKNVEPDRDLESLAPRFERAIDDANALLAPSGAKLMPGGMHPWMDPARETALWDEGDDAIYRTYDRLFGCSRHGFANLQSMHVNLPFRDDAEFARLHAAIRCVLPLVPALAASSPVADGTRQRALDHRLEAYRTNQGRVPSIAGAVVPDVAHSRAHYEASVLAPMYRDVAPLDPDGVLRHEWLNSRGAIARFDRDAIEIRLADVQECPRADLAIATAITLLVRALYEERFVPLAGLAMPTPRLTAILDATIRDADCASIDDATYVACFGFDRTPVRAHALWAACLDRLSGGAHRWCEPAWEVILGRGPLARRVAAALPSQPSRAAMRETYGALCDCLASHRMFVPR